MNSARVTQMGQTSVNRPFFEVAVGANKYAFITTSYGRLQLVGPSYLKTLGIYSSVANCYSDIPSTELKKAVGLATDGTCSRTENFPSLVLGPSLAFVNDFTQQTGWKNILPAISKTYNY